MPIPPNAATPLPQPNASATACALPAGYHSVTPYLIVHASAEAIALYTVRGGQLIKLSLTVGEKAERAQS